MPDELRLLASRSEVGYVQHPSRAMRDEPEAVSESDQQRITAAARAIATAEWAVHHEVIAGEIAWCKSQHNRREVRSLLHALERQLARLDVLMSR